jgi:hypothetical protein
MPGRVRRAAALVALACWSGLLVAGPPAGATAGQQAGPSVTVTPSTGLAVGDTVTLDGSALPPQPGGYTVVACRPEVAGALGSTDVEDYWPHCQPLSVSRLTAAAPSVQLTVATPAWAYVGALADVDGTVDPIYLAPVAVDQPVGPVVSLSVAPELRAGERPQPSGYVWPDGDAVSFRICQAVPADLLDQGEVDASCGEQQESLAVRIDGSFGPPNYGRRVALGDVGVWAFVDTPDGRAVTFQPFTVVPGGPDVTVTPSAGAEVGDTVTVAGTGLRPNTSAFFIRRVVVACRGDVVPIPPEASWFHFMAHCRQFYNPQVPDTDSFSWQLTVETPAWEYVGLLDPLEPDNTIVVPLTVDAPPGPRLDAHLVDTTMPEGDEPAVAGYVLPGVATDLSFRRCQGSVADPLDTAAVEAACRPPTVMGTWEDGALGGSRLSSSVDSRVRVGDTGLWVGGEAGGQAVAAFLPYAVEPASVTVTPGTDLAVNQVVRVDAAGYPQLAQFLFPCDGGVLADGAVTVAEVVADCAPAAASNFTAADGTLSWDYQVRARITVGDGGRQVDCTAGPGACALVVGRDFPFTGDDWVPLAGAPLSFGTAPPLPILVPGSAVVTEGDTGSVTAQVPVRLSAPSAVPVTVHYGTFDYAAFDWVALADPILNVPPDYVPTEGTLTFAPGETAKSVLVEVLGDTVNERDEMVLLGLRTPTGAGIGGYGGVGGAIILDDE